MQDVPPEKWSKVERIQFLLDSWDEIFDPNTTAPLTGMSVSDGGGVALMPKMSRSSSVRELVRCLEVLARDHPRLYQHLKAYRCGAEWRITEKSVQRRLPSGKWETADIRQRERIVPRWIRKGYVHAAEKYLERVFRGPVSIPKELWDVIRTV